MKALGSCDTDNTVFVGELFLIKMFIVLFPKNNDKRRRHWQSFSM